VVCILLHDIGHWGKDYLDDYELKKQHAELGAKVALRLFGQKGYDLIVGHNPYNGFPRSALFNADKYSWVIAPLCWTQTNSFFEPKLRRRGCTRRESSRMYREAMRENMKGGFQQRGHDIYLRQRAEEDG